MYLKNYEKFTTFFNSSSPFSEWHHCRFKVDDIQYSSIEQFMMHQKALYFGDKETADAIMNESDPYKIKAMGRKVKNVENERWLRVCEWICYEGNMAKFTQVPYLKKELMETEGTLLVKASPNDVIWGIGLEESDPKVHNMEEWKGKNLLGRILTEIRERIREQDIEREEEMLLFN
jgi:ribA/ribD-fused uncharacterized protein